jgi:hypothetical protein
MVARLGSQMLLARCVGMAAEIGIADLVATVPRSPAELAATCGVHADALMRILRFLAANGIFRADEAGRIHNTDASEVFRADAPESLRDLVRQSWQDVIWDTYRHLPQTLKTGAPAFTAAFGMDFFDYLAAHPEIGARFDASMARMSAAENPVIAQAYDFGGKQIVDVGGGQGGLLAAILAAHPSARGVLYDQPHVLANSEHLAVAAFKDRCTLANGNFFDAVPTGGDVYILKRILHDWPDDKAVRILTACRAAMAPTARVLVIDAIIKPGNDADANKLLDVGIMALLNGRERTAEDFRSIFANAGLGIRQIIPPHAPSTLSLIEGEILP